MLEDGRSTTPFWQSKVTTTEPGAGVLTYEKLKEAFDSLGASSPPSKYVAYSWHGEPVTKEEYARRVVAYNDPSVTPAVRLGGGTDR